MSVVRVVRWVMFALGCALWSRAAPAQLVQPSRAAAEHLTFQTSQPWSPHVDVNADTVLVYGITPSLPARMAILFGVPGHGK